MDKLESLRQKHPRLIYDSFQLVKNEGNFTITFKFILEPDIIFQPTLIIPLLNPPTPPRLPPDYAGRFIKGEERWGLLNNIVFNLGLIEMISYWKAACPGEIVIKAGFLSPEQIAWWKNELINGLGEFFYVNQIDFTTPDFLNITNYKLATNERVTRLPAGEAGARDTRAAGPAGNLILSSGGKDSVVTLNLLPKNPNNNLLLLNPTPSAIDIAGMAGYRSPMIVQRNLDPQLIRMNVEDYLNGHTPFSAYLAFLGHLVGFINNFEYVIASNEQSANQGNLKYRNLVINHQYSKSYQFETNFRGYAQKYLGTFPQYFSFLRPLSEISIAAIFTKYPDYFKKFVSCNKMGGKSWCKKCAKCAFVYLSLYAYIPEENMVRIFGEELFMKPEIQAEIQKLLGLYGHKPFDCVGTKEETIFAVAQIIQHHQSLNLPLPVFITVLQEKLNLDEQRISSILGNNLLQRFNPKHFLPNKFAQILQNAVSNL